MMTGRWSTESSINSTLRKEKCNLKNAAGTATAAINVNTRDGGRYGLSLVCSGDSKQLYFPSYHNDIEEN